MGVRATGSSVRAAVLVAAVAAVLLPRAAPGTVAEQRARLPPPAEDCSDPVAGVWRAHIYSPQRRVWHVQTLRIERVPSSADRLEGTITAEVWPGGPDQQEPGPCRGGTHYRVVMQADGSVHNGEILFRGVDLRLDEVLCGTYRGYNKDRFTGKIDPARQEFQCVNNDGGQAVNAPRVFRRIRCQGEPDTPPPTVAVKPPPFVPDRQSGGCGCT